MDSRTTSFAKEVTLDSDKPNQLDQREGITQEFNNNSSPFIIQENSGRVEEGTQKGEHSDEGTQGLETFNSAAANEPKVAGNEQRQEELKERYAHLKEDLPDNSREQQSRQIEGNDSVKDERQEQLKERYENQSQELEKEEKHKNLDNGYSL